MTKMTSNPSFKNNLTKIERFLIDVDCVGDTPEAQRQQC